MHNSCKHTTQTVLSRAGSDSIRVVILLQGLKSEQGAEPPVPAQFNHQRP